MQGYFTTIKINSADNDLNTLPGNLDVKASIEDPHEDVEEANFFMKEPDESVDSEDRETDDESSVAIDLSHLSVNVSIVNSTFSDGGETTLSVNDTLMKDLMNSNGRCPRGASYQVDQVSIDFDDSEIVVYIDEDSLSSADEAIEPASTKESVATAQKDFAEEHETLKLDATVNANENAMTSLHSEENEGNNIETVDSRLGGVNDNIEAVSKVPTEIECIETEDARTLQASN